MLSYILVIVVKKKKKKKKFLGARLMEFPLME